MCVYVGSVVLGVLLPTECEEHEVLQTGSIHVAILPSCQYFTKVHFKALNSLFIWVVNIRNTSEHRRGRSLLYIYQEGWQADILVFVVMSDHGGHKVPLIGQDIGILC